MVDLTRVGEFEWDSGNEGKSEKHGVTKQEAEQVFLHQPLLLLEDAKHNLAEPRFHALGKSGEGGMLHVSFTLRGAGTKIRVISARSMHWKERVVYEKAAQVGS